MRRKIQQEEERMRGVETRIQEIRHAIFTEVAKMAYDVDSPVEKTIEEIPYRVIPGEVGNFRNDVFLERAIVGERLRLAMGLPCRSAAEHAPISDNIKLADQAETYYTPPLINVIKFACNACHEKRVLITEGCQGCLAHPCVEVCPKKAITLDRTNGRSYIDQDKCVKCGQCAKVCGYQAIIIQERPCARACGMDAIGSDENGKADIDYEKCVSCGQCLVNCPFGAISDKSQIFQVIRAIQSGERVYAALAPAFVGQFGPKVTPGTWIYRCQRSSDRSGSLCGTGGRGFCERSSGETAVYGDILLSGLVCNGEETVPGLRKLYLDGTDPDDADGASDQETQSECEGCLCRTVCGEKTGGHAPVCPQ